MSTIGNVSSLSNWSYIQPSLHRITSTKADSYADSNVSGETKLVNRGANFMQNILQALRQSLGGNITNAIPVANNSPATTAALPNSTNSSTSTTQDIMTAVQAFMHNLFSALDQNGNSSSSAASTDSDGNNDGSGTSSGIGNSGSNLAVKIQSLLQQLSANNQNASTFSQSSLTITESTLTMTPNSLTVTQSSLTITESTLNVNQSDSTGTQSGATGTQGNISNPLNDLISSFQNMIQSLDPSFGSSKTNANDPTLQTFLQNLLQDLNSGQNISGALVNTHV